MGSLVHFFNFIQNIQKEFTLNESEEKNPNFSSLQHKWALIDIGDHPMKGERELDEYDNQNMEIIRLLNTLKAKRIAEENDDKIDVLIRLEVTNIDKINTQEENVLIDFTVTCYWKDECLVGDDNSCGHSIHPDQYKNGFFVMPNFEVIGEVELDQLIDEKEMFYMEFLWSDFGIVMQKRQYRGTIRFPMNLRHFPFDIQNFKLELKSKWNVDYLQYHNFTSEKEIDRMTSLVRLNEWEKISSFYVHSEIVENIVEGISYSHLIAEIPIKRNTNYYLQKIISLQVLISLLLFPFFALPYEDLNDRLANTLTLLLAAIAFNFTVVGELPKISYTSSLDYFFNFNYLFLGVTALSHFIIYFVNDYNNFFAFSLFFIYIITTYLLLRHSFSSRSNQISRLLSSVVKTKID